MGRSFDEYVALFALSPEDLRKRILGCGDGPAAFNAQAMHRGCRVISADPLYQFSASQIRSRIDETAATITAQTRANAHEFVWSHFRSVEELIDVRMRAMHEFLEDYSEGVAAGRYVAASLPALPFRDDAFDLALCSHFLFLYSHQHNANFHVTSLHAKSCSPSIECGGAVVS